MLKSFITKHSNKASSIQNTAAAKTNADESADLIATGSSSLEIAAGAGEDRLTAAGKQPPEGGDSNGNGNRNNPSSSATRERNKSCTSVTGYE